MRGSLKLRGQVRVFVTGRPNRSLTTRRLRVLALTPVADPVIELPIPSSAAKSILLGFTSGYTFFSAFTTRGCAAGRDIAVSKSLIAFLPTASFTRLTF